MVKTKSSFMSLEASGSFASTLISQSWKGRSYLRKLTLPAQPNSGKQIAIRSMFGFLSLQWTAIADVDKTTWEPPAAERDISPFNAYVQENMIRFTIGKAPGQTYPVSETGTPADIPAESAVPLGTGLLTTGLTTPVNDNWGIQLHRGTAPAFTPDLGNIIAVIQGTTAAMQKFFDYPLASGTWYYRWRPFTLDGNYGALDNEFNGTVP